MKTSFILHHDSLSVLDELTDEQAGILFKAIKDYQLGKDPQLDFGMRMALLPFINQFIRDGIKYDNNCEKNRINGKKGGRPKKQTKANESEKTQVVYKKPKKGDSDNDSVSDSESKIPIWDEFLSYAIEKKPLVNKEDLKLKYEAWLENNWGTEKNGKWNPIKKWKTTLLNTLPYIRIDESKAYIPLKIHE